MALRKSSFFIRFLILGALAHVYVGIRLIPDAPLGPAWQAGAALVLIASCILIPLGMLSRSSGRPPWADRMAWAGFLAMGFFSSLFVLTVLRDVTLAAGGLLRLAAGFPELARWRQGTALAVPLLALAGSALGFFNARRLARVTRVDVPIAGLPPELDGLRIAQISDIHVGPTIKAPYVRAIVEAVNALQPDIVAITGDVVDGSVAQLAPHTRPLAGLRAPGGVYLVTGNHEYYSGAASWIAEFRRLGLKVLLNEHVVLEVKGRQVVVAGVTDFGAGAFDPGQRSNPGKALRGAPADAPVKLLLAHQPRSALAAAPLGYTLQLSGHTHGGQFFPWGFFVRLQQPFTAGLHRQDGLWVYTSRGTGYWGPPMRLAAPSEISLVRLVRAI
ncbi:metallophosphoesterase [Bordetella hinzii]|uniref:Metallophosphoesterase n=1 Tax=Bordetella hinzii TaxID=103855 RepID=A0AAN1RX86_9BORD|nr:metallophosphoesterase [Bordetella hinzii]AKQ56880.1 putative metallophosphoesterase [Bordetella hinzii]AKQ61347.1 putative metallophosphoesterase [Bordetella hinzii]AZW17674.1 metallophosphoesterase [Bordetella hinzii]KCB26358.1 calcineurin-like phosphoesterase family protein [Bordetella hinzii L60]KCB33921.1 calcineurin-like phosphoesterase family protein [Bordetella hinzii CA90 BAL1384]